MKANSEVTETPPIPSDSGALTEETQTATVRLNVSGRSVQAEITVPTGPTPPAQMVPLFNSLADMVVAFAVEDAEQNGDRVSCCKGCGACCRQLVPISPHEARWIADYVESLPEPRRAQVRDRFEAARRKLDDAGVLEQLRNSEAFPAEEIHSFGLDYFDLGIPCPFLEEESCSIHPDRPLICREFLVTSPAENCSRPREGDITKVGLSGRISDLVARLGEETPSEIRPWVPLSLALEWVEAHPETTPMRSGPSLLEEFFVRMAVESGAVINEAASEVADTASTEGEDRANVPPDMR